MLKHERLQRTPSKINTKDEDILIGSEDPGPGPETDNSLATKTYERVVLEGSKISISCPHSLTIAPETSFVSVQRSSVPDEQKLPGFVEGQQRQQTSHPNLAAFEQVKWFRNHVPLLNLNHFQHQQDSPPDSYDKALVEPTEPTDITELNRTTKLSKTTTFTTNNEQRQTTHDYLLKILNSVKYSDSLANGENVNELEVGIRKLTNMSELQSYHQEKQERDREDERWYINKFGELVISKVSQYFAGKYTCLVAGRQSEVLLDVLMDSLATDRTTPKQAFKIEQENLGHEDRGVEVHATGLLGRDRDNDAKVALLGKEFFNQREFSMGYFGDDHGAGNGPIEGMNNCEQSKTSTMPSISLLDRLATTTITATVFERGSKQKDNSSVDNSASVEVDSIKTFRDDIKSGGTGSEKKNEEKEELFSLNASKRVLKESDERNQKTILKDIDGVERNFILPAPSRFKEARKMNNSKLSHSKKTHRYQSHHHHQQQHPVHIVKSEIIQINDLKLIPGFLYTKQQLYCPLTEQQDGLHREHIYSFIHAICPIRSKTNYDSREDEQLKCCQLAELLILQIYSSQESGNCSTSILDMVWFKDGKQLEFDTNGRGVDTNLNVKLINFSDQFGEKASSSISGNSFATTVSSLSSDQVERNERGSNIEMNSSQISSTPSKWICPPKGRTLEIDGVRKDSAGRYTCALKLSISKLDKIVQSLRQLSLPEWPIKWNDSVNDNDISCCDELRLPISSDFQRERSSLSLKLGAQIEEEAKKTIRSKSNVEREVLLEHKEMFEKQEIIISGNGGDSLNERIALLESILNETLPSKQSLNYIEQVLSNLENPLTAIQTFSLVVTERAANSCDLWSTIMEAGNAYTRRKLADFKRIKRNIERRKDHRVLSGNNVKNVHSFVYDKSSSPMPLFLSIKIPVQDVANVVLPIKRLNSNMHWTHESGNGQYSMEIESQYQGNHSNQSDGSQSNGSSGSNGTSYMTDKCEDTGDRPLNGSHSMPGNNDISQRVVTVDQRVYNLVLNNTGQIGAGIEADQTNSRLVHVTPFNYANEEKHLIPKEPEFNIEGVMNRVQTRRKRSSMNKGNDDYSGLGTKDLITQRASHRINIAPAIELKDEDFQTDEYPMVIDDLQDKTLVSIINDDSVNRRLNRGDTATSQPILVRNYDRPKTSRVDDGNVKSNVKIQSQFTSAGLSIEETEENIQRQNSRQRDKLQPLNTRYYQNDNHVKRSELNKTYTQTNMLAELLIDIGTTNSSEEKHPYVPFTIESNLSNSKTINREQGSTASGEASYQIDESTKLPTTESMIGGLPFTSDRDNRFDEDLLWTSSQYLYMHMRALAASSIFGVNVDVEWSNERSNSTNIDLEVNETKKESELMANPKYNYFRYTQIRGDTAPFATIDVISGQNLHLQCTAQALGRLPEVRWYKRVNTIPSRLKGLVKIIRKIGNDLYWPLTELDLLIQNEDDNNLKIFRSFVCSQTTTIFDNLANQTFTVISNLQLSQYNDRVESGIITSNSSPVSSNYNLYACIVDADIRHNYATLGVRLRQVPSNKVAFEISKRLHARSVLPKLEPSDINRRSLLEKDSSGQNNHANFDLFRENHLQFHLNSHWVPIQNGSNSITRKDIITPYKFLLTPAMLSIIIVFVFSFLVSLLYLTMRSYKSLRDLQLENDFDDHQLIDNHTNETVIQRKDEIKSASTVAKSLKNENTLQRIRSKLIQEVNSNNNTHSSCLCHLESNRSHGSTSFTIIPEVSDTCDENSSFSDINMVNKSNFIVNKMSQVLYEAHTHNVESYYACQSVVASIMAELPSDSNNNPDYSCSQYYHHQQKSYQQPASGCCQSSSLYPIMSRQPYGGLIINMVENPLNGGQDQYFTDDSK